MTDHSHGSDSTDLLSSRDCISLSWSSSANRGVGEPPGIAQADLSVPEGMLLKNEEN